LETILKIVNNREIFVQIFYIKFSYSTESWKIFYKEPIMAKQTQMTTSAAARIQSATAKANGGSTPKGSFGARAQSVAAKNSSKGGK